MLSYFDRFDSQRILIIGDVMIDTYLWGKVDRISPEAPVPIVSVTTKEARLGGAANVALNVKTLGATPIICAAIGDDAEGRIFTELLRSQNLSDEGIITIKNRPTTNKTRVIGHHQQMIRIDFETDKILVDSDLDILTKRIIHIIDSQKIDAIIFEDYDKGLITEKLIKDIITLASQKNIPTFADPKSRNFMHYNNISVFKPNLKELKDGLKKDINPKNLDDLDAAVQTIQNRLSASKVMVTLSELGVYISSDNGQKKLIPAHIRNIADVSGAGDTVIATAAVCLASGMDEFQMAEVANIAGGLVCEYVGAVSIDKKKLLEEVLKN